MIYLNYKQYPKVPGIIHIKNEKNIHLFTNYSLNIQDRIEYLDTQHKSGCPSNWSPHRASVAMASNKLVFEYIEMPTATEEILRPLAKLLDSYSTSKQI